MPVPNIDPTRPIASASLLISLTFAKAGVLTSQLEQRDDLIHEESRRVLRRITLSRVSPFADGAPLDLAPRLNLLTGDNGVGKTFLLDLIWTTLSQTWPKLESWFDAESYEVGQYPKILVEGHRAENNVEYEIEIAYSFRAQRWNVGDQSGSEVAGPSNWSGPALYFGAQGDCRLWDPARDPRTLRPGREGDDYFFHFTPENLENGLTSEQGNVVCEGLIRDLVNWQRSGSPAFHQLQAMLRELSDGTEVLVLGPPTKVSLEDVRDHPTLKLPYGLVPYTNLSAGMKRIVSVAYMLVWAWQEHLRACKLRQLNPTNQMVILFDELETHLHPRWQRLILPAVFRAIDGLTEKQSEVQLFATTHTPIIPASVETEVEPGRDRLLHFDLDEDGLVRVEEIAWAKFGDAAGWLTSPAFNLEQGGYSVEAERAMKAADDLMANLRRDLPPAS